MTETIATGIPQPTDWHEHTRCEHGAWDITGYVVTFTHFDPATGKTTFEDIEYLNGASKYATALEIVRGTRAVIARGIKDATYAVIHDVYGDGHRPV